MRQAGVDLVEVRESDPDLEQSLSILRALRNLPRGYAERRKGGAPLLMGFGLYQGGHSKAAEQAYLEALQRVLLPRILLRLERYLQDHQSDPLAIYEPLKVYLMLGGQGPLDRKAVKAWVENDWATASMTGADREATRKELSDHLDALMGDKHLGRFWAANQAPLDGALIGAARAAVQRLSLADRAYAILRQKAATMGEPWQAGTVLASGDAKAFAGGDAVLGLSVPYFFTKEGYQKAYLAGLATVQNDLKSELWVLGSDADTTAIRSQISGVRPGVAAAYAREYIAAWDGVLKALQPADYFNDPAAFGAFTRVPSPLKLILLELRKNTTFSGGAMGAAQNAIGAKLGKAGALLGDAADGGGVDAGQQIQSYFKPTADYVGDGKQPAPIDDFVTAMKSAQSANAAAGAALADWALFMAVTKSSIGAGCLPSPT